MILSITFNEIVLVPKGGSPVTASWVKAQAGSPGLSGLSVESRALLAEGSPPPGLAGQLVRSANGWAGGGAATEAIMGSNTSAREEETEEGKGKGGQKAGNWGESIVYPCVFTVCTLDSPNNPLLLFPSYKMQILDFSNNNF